MAPPERLPFVGSYSANPRDRHLSHDAQGAKSLWLVLHTGCLTPPHTRHNASMRPPPQPLRPPFRLLEHEESFAVVDANGTHVASIYFEEEPGRRGTMKRMSRETARRMATQIVRLPELLDEVKRLRVSRDDPA